jgi:hypothetical protein
MPLTAITWQVNRANILFRIYRELLERSVPAWVTVRITNGMATDFPTKGNKSDEINLVFPRTHVLFSMYPDVTNPVESFGNQINTKCQIT